jgi:HNH endonuclease
VPSRSDSDYSPDVPRTKQSAVPPPNLKLSKGIRSELPEGEVDTALDTLWQKSGGVCALCALPLPADGKNIDIDHKVARAEGKGGTTTLKNLYLAHRECNRSRRNLPFDLASRVIRFQKWCTAESRRNFEDVVEHYLPSGNERVAYTIKNGKVTLSFGHDKRQAAISEDPATRTPYFFMDVPVDYVRNDFESQPRRIEHDHVRTLAVDFHVHPVHEPSNCRLVPDPGHGGVADLLQFDGQHKTTAQIILGRSEVPMKIYVDPSEPMIQELVVQIQQGIKKRPLTTSDTLKKLDDVVQHSIHVFTEEHGEAPTEMTLVEAQPKQNQAEFKKRLLSNFEWAIFDDDDCLLHQFTTSKASREKPFTDTVVIRRLIKPLVSQELIDERLDDAVQRDTERAAVLRMTNRIADTMYVDKWDPKKTNDEEDLLTRRARNFSYQAAIGWWLGDILLPAITMFIPKPRWKRLFLEQLTDDQEMKIDDFIDTLCAWPIWSTTDETQLAALRSNTVANVVKAFSGYNQVRLITDAQAAE